MRIVNIVGTRPNLVKIAPVMEQMALNPDVEGLLVHTGQHYDENLSRIFFRELGIPEPDVYLGVGSGSHALQTARVMQELEPVFEGQAPDAVLVVGDVNSTLAAAITAAKMGIPVVHLEAGLRSYDRSMPEEINRVLTDAVSDLCLTSCSDAQGNLEREGIPTERIRFVGNVMIDTLLKHKRRAEEMRYAESVGLEPGGYVLMTLHRPSNVDVALVLAEIVEAALDIQTRTPVLFAVHPRTRKNLESFGLWGRLSSAEGLMISGPVGYLEFLSLMGSARLVLTDSGGIQEETTILQVPCLTLRPNTERPVTITEGTNRLVESDRERIVEAVDQVLRGETVQGRVPQLWDGGAAVRAVSAVVEWAQAR